MRTMLIFNGGLFLINAVLFVALWLGTRRTINSDVGKGSPSPPPHRRKAPNHRGLFYLTRA